MASCTFKKVYHADNSCTRTQHVPSVFSLTIVDTTSKLDIISMSDPELRTNARPLRPSAHVVAQQLGAGTVLINLQTNQIYELNRTARRIWELIVAGLDRAAISERVTEEFDVTSEEVRAGTLSEEAFLKSERLIADDDGSSH